MSLGSRAFYSICKYALPAESLPVGPYFAIPHLRPVQFAFQILPSALPFSQMTMTLTPKAASQLAAMLADRADSANAGLRLAVRRGGCAGWQYEMQVAEAQQGDEVIEQDGARLIVAADSRERLAGCEIDYTDDLSDAGFKVLNPNASRSCGCGTSFEAADEEPGAHAVPDGEACGD